MRQVQADHRYHHDRGDTTMKTIDSAKVARSRRGHGKKRAIIPEYYTWSGMRSRCNNRSSVAWANYGGRGIKVCDRWEKSFDSFLLDMGRRPKWASSIDRINNSGDYEPGNCRWANHETQSNNKRGVYRFIYDGEKKGLAAWGRDRRCATSATGIRRRLSWRWTFAQALTNTAPDSQPRRRKKKKLTPLYKIKGIEIQ